MIPERENKFKKEIEEIYKSQNLKKEIRPTEKDIRKINRINLVLKIFGYFFLVLYSLLFLKIEPISSMFNSIPMSDGFNLFLTFVSLVFIYFAIVDMFKRLKKLLKKNNQK
jgi:predicted membrane protein